MIEAFASFITDKDKPYVIFDIGSRDCAQSIEFYKTFPHAKIYAFECNPNTLEICRKNIAPYTDRITLVEGAVCDYDGSITFYPINQAKTVTTWKDGNPGASSLFKSNGKYVHENYVQDEITTNCHRLDTVMATLKISHVDLIWMDLQGAELLALKGLGTALQTVQWMHTEVSHRPIYSGQVMFKELNDFMTQNTFVVKNNLSMGGWQEDVIYYNDRATTLSDIKKVPSIAMITFCAGEDYKKCMTLGISSKTQYCTKHGIPFIIADEKSACYDKRRPFSWSKIRMIKQYLRDYDYIFWSDADVLIKNFDFDLKAYIGRHPEANFIFSHCWNTINAGNFFIKNTAESMEMLDLIYDQHRYISHGWWEQAAIIHLLKANERFCKMTFIEKESRLFNAYSLTLIAKEGAKSSDFLYQPNDFLIHYCGIDIKTTQKLMQADSLPSASPPSASPADQFDIVIPVGPNDQEIVRQQIDYTKKNILGYRKIYIISAIPGLDVENCVTIHESTFPFSIETVASIHGSNKRNGWYLQQLLKLYAGLVIPDILDRWLLIDADTFFMKPTTFVENNQCLYNYGTEYHKPYFAHMSLLDKDFTKMDPSKSGICHHMILEKRYVLELIEKVEQGHKDSFYNTFLRKVQEQDVSGSGASEYELYFNYMLKYHADKIQIRKLKWKNAVSLNTDTEHDYISIHWYNRQA
jgi:FkbM family methyltransferase